ncbi:MAG: ActS/PrrB/RegB family redox-sensitive histidine kinase [Hyphomicrobiaceae bacterium]
MFLVSSGGINMPYTPRHMIRSGSTSRLRLQTIVRLRWIAVAGQTLAVLIVAYGLGFPMPLGPVLGVISVSAWVNLLLRIRYPARHRLSDGLATVLLVYDVAELAALLYLTGGVQNPFVFLIIAPVTVAAAMLSLKSTLIVGGAGGAAAVLTTLYYLPLPWHAGESLETPMLYRGGMLAAVLCGIVFIGFYARRLAKETRQMSEALAATELVLAREQKLHALDGLAAAAAHELGTPLATITVIAKELERDLGPDSPIAEDIALLRSQAQRCREILGTLTERSDEGDPLHQRLPITHLIDEAVEPYSVFETPVRVIAGPSDGTKGAAAAEPVGRRLPGVVHGLANLVENAVDFARSEVEITAEWNGEDVIVTVSDDGPGFPAGVLDSLGEPYVTTRRLEARNNGEDGAGGLGLGFFIAKTLLERSGARIDLANRAHPEQGALVRISWPREVFEPGAAEEGRDGKEGRRPA